MNAAAKRVELIEWILNLNEDALMMIDDIKENILTHEVLAYTATGEPLTKEKYINHINQIRQSAKSGAKNYSTTEVRGFVLNEETI